MEPESDEREFGRSATTSSDDRDVVGSGRSAPSATLTVRDCDQKMKREGDFVVYGSETSRSRHALDDTIVMTVRWQSVV